MGRGGSAGHTDWLSEGPVQSDRRQRLQRRGPFAAPRFGDLADSFVLCGVYEFLRSCIYFSRSRGV